MIQQNFFYQSLSEPQSSLFLENNVLSQEGIQLIQATIWDYYKNNKRDFAWRATIDPYCIVVSEIMLQQTQTERVKQKYVEWIAAFPTFAALANASQRDVLALWSGLGYNRRGVALHKIAQKVVSKYNGILPNDPKVLEEFPGLGPATAASICAFAYNRATPFIETNIRTVFLHICFRDAAEKIHDRQLLPLIAQTLDQANPREWYYALMDYGVMLKKKYKNPSRKSVHHARQSTFEGSERQIRGMILKILTTMPAASFEVLCELIQREPQRVEHNLQGLIKEKLVSFNDGFYFI